MLSQNFIMHESQQSSRALALNPLAGGDGPAQLTGLPPEVVVIQPAGGLQQQVEPDVRELDHLFVLLLTEHHARPGRRVVADQLQLPAHAPLESAASQ